MLILQYLTLWFRFRFRVGVRVIVIQLYNEKHGSLQHFLCVTVGREQDSEAKVYGFKSWSGERVS